MSRKSSRSAAKVYHLASQSQQQSYPNHDDHSKQNFHANPKSLRIRLEELITVDPLTDNQRLFFDLYDQGETFIVLHGVAGSGKSYVSLYKAFEEVLDKSSIYKKVIIIRSATTSREVGHLPGSLEDKTAILTQPYINICSSLFNRKDAYDRLVEQKYLEFISTSYIRGLTFDDSIIIVDECQNLGWHELSTICGRIGVNSKIMFCGDYRQNDLIMRNNDKSGLIKFLTIAEKMESFRRVEFEIDDIVRSGLVKEWIIACTESGIHPSD